MPRNHLEEHEECIKFAEDIEEQELLLEFLLQVQQRKLAAAGKLQEALSCLSSDIEEVMEQQMVLLNKRGGSFPKLKRDQLSVFDKVDFSSQYFTGKGSTSLGLKINVREGQNPHHTKDWREHADEVQKSETENWNQKVIFSKGSRLMKNFKKLESAYLSSRCKPNKPNGERFTRSSPIGGAGWGSLVLTEGSSVDNLVSKGYSKGGSWINPFLEGLCKYLSFSNLKVRADLKQGDLLNSPSLVCSLSFDRDTEFFAMAGVNKKIKVFDCNMILNENRDFHYPVTEMASQSRLSCICWNGYIKNQIASSDFEGVIQVG